MKRILASALLLLMAAGCATSIPQTASISDALMMGIKPSEAKTIDFEYQSDVQDGVIKPCAKGTRNVEGGPGYTHTENSTLHQMLQDYVSMKFPNASPGNSPKVGVQLKDFWLEQYSTDSTGKQILVALGGGEINMMIVAHLNLQFEVKNGDKTTTRSVMVSGDSVHVQGVGTGTETSNLYRGRDSIQFRVASAISAANNKAIAMLNQVVEADNL